MPRAPRVEPGVETQTGVRWPIPRMSRVHLRTNSRDERRLMQRSNWRTPRSRADRDWRGAAGDLDALCRVIDEQSGLMSSVVCSIVPDTQMILARRSHLPDAWRQPSHHWRSRRPHFVRRGVTSRRQVDRHGRGTSPCSPQWRDAARCRASRASGPHRLSKDDEVLGTFAVLSTSREVQISRARSSIAPPHPGSIASTASDGRRPARKRAPVLDGVLFQPRLMTIHRLTMADCCT